MLTVRSLVSSITCQENQRQKKSNLSRPVDSMCSFGVTHYGKYNTVHHLTLMQLYKHTIKDVMAKQNLIFITKAASGQHSFLNILVAID